MIRLLSAVALLLVAGCQSLSDVKPGDGQRATITSKDYPAIWNAAVKVTTEHFEIREQDEPRGIILAERTYHFTIGSGAWVGVFITPPHRGAESYTPM